MLKKKDVVHIYSGILISHKKEQNWVICRDVDASRDCHTEWSTSEREKQISYINAYMWNLEKWYRRTYFQSRNWDTEVEKKTYGNQVGNAAGGGVCGVMIWEIGIDMHTLVCIKWMTNKKINK